MKNSQKNLAGFSTQAPYRSDGYTYRIQALMIDGHPDDGIQTITGRTVWFDGLHRYLVLQRRRAQSRPNAVTREFCLPQLDAKRAFQLKTFVSAVFINMLAGPLDMNNDIQVPSWGSMRFRIF
jgi:hypothetical protein